MSIFFSLKITQKGLKIIDTQYILEYNMLEKAVNQLGIAERLVEIREKNGYTRKKLAEELGRPYATVTKYETGEREPGHAYIIEIAQKFGVTTDYILGIEKSPVPAEAGTGDTRLDGIIENYGQLNDAGKDDLAKHAQHLTYIPEYKKCDSVCEESQIG